jgi:putative SOS response-associated peptidase YedK
MVYDQTFCSNTVSQGLPGTTPPQDVPVIFRNDDRSQARLMKWGLVPSWSQDPSFGNRMINARAETLLEKPSFKKLVGTKRCLIPADGFYEWRREGNRKVPVWIHLKKREPFVFAGRWDYWHDRDSGRELYTFTNITCAPNALLRPIHNRMPGIYDDAMGRQWLERRLDAMLRVLPAVLGPYPSELMEAHNVSTLVNSPENDIPTRVQPTSVWQSNKSQSPLL